MPNPNTNCLEGMRCPDVECGSYGPFSIEGTSQFLTYDDGTEEHGDIAWTGKNVYCVECGYRGDMDKFRNTEEE